MKNNNIYEIGMLINPNLAQQGAEKAIDNVKNIISKAGASVISEGEVVDIDLAYQIITKIASINERFDKAFFTWVKFKSNPSNVPVIKTEVDKIKKEIFRFLIVKTVESDEDTDKYLLDSEEETESEEIKEDSEEKDLSDEEVNEVDEKIEVDEKKETETLNDDLTKIEGIGPKTAEVLNTKNINTFAELADSKVADLRDILEENGLSRYDPKTWSKQARLARDERWDKLEELQKELNGGE